MQKNSFSFTTGAKIALAIGLLAAIVHTGTSIYAVYRQSILGPQAGLPVSDQVASFTALLIAADRDEEKRLLRAINSPYVVVKPLNGPPPGAEKPSWPFGGMMAGWVERDIVDEIDRDGIEVSFNFIDRETAGVTITAPRLPVDDRLMRFIVTIPDGRRYLFITDSPFVSLGMMSRQFGNTLFIVLIVVVFGLFVMRHLAAPLSRFSHAARQLSNDINSPPLDETRGLREVREAAAAFNQMQAGIKSLMDERTRMLAAISHDMRTIVTRWGLRAENIEDQTLRNRSLSDVRDLTQMLEQFLDFAKSSNEALNIRKTEICSLVTSLCDEYGEDGAAIDHHVGAQCFATTDGGALKRILRNLISNALKYGDRAHIKVTPTDDHINITIRDYGPGVPVATLATIRKPYERLDKARNSSDGGVGLGLAIVDRLAERLGVSVNYRPLSDPSGLEARLFIPTQLDHVQRT